MMDSRLYMGIDGGGTRTTVLVADANGNVLSKKTGADTNFYISGLHDSRKKLMHIIADIAHEVDLEHLAHAFIGSSAVDYSVDDETVQAYTEGILRCNVTMKSDAFAALAGHTLGGKGNLVISGTGSVGIAMNSERKIYLAGGWGHLLGDDGSAYDIAIKGIRAAVRSFDQLEEPTSLADALMAKYNLDTPYQLIQSISPKTSRAEIAAFSETVKHCAEQGDAVSIAILKEAACYLAKLGESISRFSQSSDIAVYGSVLVKDAIVRQHFEEEYRRRVPDGRVCIPQLPAEAGAVLLAMQADGQRITDSMVQHLKSDLKVEG